MGMGAADTEGRLAASVGELDAVVPDFPPALDVPNAGVLCALPALPAVGLLQKACSWTQRQKERPDPVERTLLMRKTAFRRFARATLPVSAIDLLQP